MRVFIASFCHESSTFSPVPTSRRSFEEFEYFRPNGLDIDARATKLNGYGAFVRRALSRGDTPILSTYAFAQPGSPIKKQDYESIRDEILSDLENVGRVDAVLLFLHGAQMADGYDDCEGDMLSKVRAIIGDEPFVGALLDLHANITDDMIGNSDALVACRLYPHIDFDERAEHLYELAVASVHEGVALRTYFRSIPILSMYYTTAPKMEAVNDAALKTQQLEDIRSVSMIHGFPWTDAPTVSAGVLITYVGDQVDVEALAEKLATQFFDARMETPSMRIDIDRMLDIAEQNSAGNGPIIAADAADNPGGGAPSDSTFILSRILAKNLSGYLLGLFWDPGSVQVAFDLGVGGRFRFRIGGKSGQCSGDPVDIVATVRDLKSGMSQSGIGYMHPIGDAALLEFNDNLIVICSIRGQVFSPTCFTDFGLDLSMFKCIIVKSTQHFYAQFAPIAKEVVYVETPGLMTLDFRSRTYHRVGRPIWPIDELIVP